MRSAAKLSQLRIFSWQVSLFVCIFNNFLYFCYIMHFIMLIVVPRVLYCLITHGVQPLYTCTGVCIWSCDCPCAHKTNMVLILSVVGFTVNA